MKILYSVATSLARFAPIGLLLFLFACSSWSPSPTKPQPAALAAVRTSTAVDVTQVYTVPFMKGNGSPALWVWAPTEAGITFTVPGGDTDYRDLTGGTTSVGGGQTITVGVE